MSTPKSKAHPATRLSEKRAAQTPSLSIVIFAFHEEENIHAVLGELGAWLDVHEPDAEIVFVDDGSRDRTAEEAVKARPHVKNVEGRSVAWQMSCRVCCGGSGFFILFFVIYLFLLFISFTRFFTHFFKSLKNFFFVSFF